MREVNKSKVDLADDAFILLEDRVQNNKESREESMLYDFLMLHGYVHNRFEKIVRKLNNETKINN